MHAWNILVEVHGVCIETIVITPDNDMALQNQIVDLQSFLIEASYARIKSISLPIHVIVCLHLYNFIGFLNWYMDLLAHGVL